MARYLAIRLLSMVPILLVVVVVGFVLLRLAPGDPATAMLPINATAGEVNALRAQLGLDRPVSVQFIRYLERLLRGDLGDSLFFRLPVAGVIATRLESTVLLTLLSGALAVGVAIPVGVWAAARRGSWVDELLQVLSLTTVSVPGFWLGLVLILFFAVQHRWFPVTGYVGITAAPLQTLRYLTLPVLTLGLSNAAAIARMARSSMLEVLSQDFVRTALAKGVVRRVMLLKHALRNAMVPMLAAIGLMFSSLLGGAAVTEIVFTIPGVGSMMVDSVGRRDYPMIQALLLMFAAATVFVHLLIDIAYALADPRIRYA